jgi:carboxypeptidase C (cathepsin A)
MRLAIATTLLIALVDMAAADGEPPVSSQGRVRIDGRTLSYTVEAGRLPIREMESDEIRGRMFYVSYRLRRSGDRPRPVVFAWGGGPSGPALRAHMAYGPKHLAADGSVVDNPDSILPAADLVFVDPIGTGFSRAEKPEYVEEFYNTIGDGRAMAEFIRVWRALNNADPAPVFLNGQSYGVWRAAIVAELLEKAGRRVAGVILTSGGTGMADEFTDPAFAKAYRTPDFAAAAFFHGRLPADVGTDLQTVLQRAETWARETYGPALAQLEQLGDEQRESLAEALSRFTGFPIDHIDRQTLIFSLPEYRRRFPGEEGRTLNLFDMREIRGGESPRVDERPAAGAQIDYLRHAIGYRTDLAYLGVESGYTPTTAPEYRSIGQRWNYNSGIGEAGREAAIAAGQGPPGREPWIRRAIDINPELRVFVAAGLYDSLNFCSANADRLRRMPDELADNFTMRCYESGHGIYSDESAYPLLTRDMRDFITGISP